MTWLLFWSFVGFWWLFIQLPETKEPPTATDTVGTIQYNGDVILGFICNTEQIHTCAQTRKDCNSPVISISKPTCFWVLNNDQNKWLLHKIGQILFALYHFAGILIWNSIFIFIYKTFLLLSISCYDSFPCNKFCFSPLYNLNTYHLSICCTQMDRMSSADSWQHCRSVGPCSLSAIVVHSSPPTEG